MTVIAVRKIGAVAEMAADEQITHGHNKMAGEKSNVWVDRNKMFSANGLTVGSAGSVKESSFFQVFCLNHKPTAATEAGLLDFVVEFLEWGRKKDKDFQLKNQYILIFKEKIFRITEGFLVMEVKSYAAIGSGTYLALGALYYKKSVKEAVKVAKEFDLYCGGKTQFLTIKLS